MTNLELESIFLQVKNSKNLQNEVLINFMDKISVEFEITKQKLIEQTYQIDKLEEMYNILLKEYQSRINE